MTRGGQGHMPDWYILLRAADRLGTSVLELEKPENQHWVFRALVAQAAENEAQEAMDKHNQWRREQGLKPM